MESPANKKSQSGFIITTILILLPVLISCLMIFISMVFSIRNYDMSQSICIKHVMQAQGQMKKKLNSLLKLNPQADLLRRMYQQFKKLYRKALKNGNAVMAVALAVKLAIIKQKRVLLDRKQKYILYQSRKIVQDSLRFFQEEMMKFNAKNIKRDHYRPIPLAVKAWQKTVAPSYYLISSFSLKQTITFFWNMPLYQFLPGWLKESFFKSNFSAYECSATLKTIGVNKVVQLTYRKSGINSLFNGFLK